MTSPEPKPVKKFTGRKALIWFVSFFAVVFSVNGIMAYIALGTWGGLETQDAYRKGIHYNEEIAAAKAQEKSGWQITLSHIPKNKKGDRLDVTVAWPEHDLPPAGVHALISRAVTDIYDQEVMLSPTDNNIYTAPILLPKNGQWNIKILVKRADGPIYQYKDKIFINPSD